MGSFNVSCGISGASINSGDRVGMIPIIPQKYEYDSKWFFGLTDKYIPICAPIYGTYNDYGNIENVTRSPIVDYIETEYDLPIDIFLKCLQADKPDDYTVKDFFYAKDSILFTNPYDPVSDEILEKMGVERYENDETATAMWKAGDYVFVEQENEGSFQKFAVSKDDKTTMIHTTHITNFVHKLHKISGKWIGLSQKDSAIFNKVSEIVWMPFLPEVFDKIVTEPHALSVTFSKSFDELIKELPEAFERGNSSYPFLMNPPLEVLKCEMSAYRQMLKHPEYWYPIFQMADVITAANKAYLPIISGNQCGNYVVEGIIGQVLLERSRAVAEEVGDYYDDFDDDETD